MRLVASLLTFSAWYLFGYQGMSIVCKKYNPGIGFLHLFRILTSIFLVGILIYAACLNHTKWRTYLLMGFSVALVGVLALNVVEWYQWRRYCKKLADIESKLADIESKYNSKYNL